MLIKRVKMDDASDVWRFYIVDELSPYYEIREGPDTEKLIFCCDTLRRIVIGPGQEYPDGAKTITDAIKMDMEKRGYYEPDLDDAPWEN